MSCRSLSVIKYTSLYTCLIGYTTTLLYERFGNPPVSSNITIACKVAFPLFYLGNFICAHRWSATSKQFIWSSHADWSILGSQIRPVFSSGSLCWALSWSLVLRIGLHGDGLQLIQEYWFSSHLTLVPRHRLWWLVMVVPTQIKVLPSGMMTQCIS